GMQHPPCADPDPLGGGVEGRQRDGDFEQRMVEGDVVARPERVEAGRLRRLGDQLVLARVRRSGEERAAALDAERAAQTRQARSEYGRMYARWACISPPAASAGPASIAAAIQRCWP